MLWKSRHSAYRSRTYYQLELHTEDKTNLHTMDSINAIPAFIDRHIELLRQERDTEVEESNLLLSNCAPKLLEKKGLALLNLSVASVQVGLGGRRYVRLIVLALSDLFLQLLHSLIELERPAAYNPSTTFPPHTFRLGYLRPP